MSQVLVWCMLTLLRPVFAHRRYIPVLLGCHGVDNRTDKIFTPLRFLLANDRNVNFTEAQFYDSHSMLPVLILYLQPPIAGVGDRRTNLGVHNCCERSLSDLLLAIQAFGAI